MKIIDILDTRNMSLSFEVFPPKKESTFESVIEATEEIAATHPAFMSVTYGAGGGTSKYTMEIAKNIREKYGVPTLAHLTCVSSSREMVQQKIKEIPIIHFLLEITVVFRRVIEVPVNDKELIPVFKKIIGRTVVYTLIHR